MSSFRIALRVLRTDRRTRTSALLIALGVAVATGLVLLLVSLPGATEARADRAAWQLNAVPSSVSDRPVGDPTIQHAASEDVTPDGQKIDRVDVAALADPSDITLPPGIDRLPGPGETLMSPALAEIVDATPGSQLGERYGERVGELGDEALAFPEQLVALVGHTPDEMPANAVELGGFLPAGEGPDMLLSLLAGVGVVVLTVPSLVLIASAARLIAARREQRLAVFRLAGATPRQVISMVAAETTIAAAAGALLGLAISPLLHHLATLVPWDGGTWQASDFELGVVPTVAIVVGVPLLVLLAAVLGLRRVLSAPLGAVGGHTPKPLHWWRLLPLPLSAAMFAYFVSEADSEIEAMLIMVSMAMIIFSINLAGPWITALVGKAFSRGWRRPSGLLAGRRLTEDPRGAYRATAGVALAVFTGAMALTVLPSLESLSGASREYADGVQYVQGGGADLQRIAGETNDRLARYGQSERAVVVGEAYLGAGDRQDEYVKVVDCRGAEQVLPIDMRGACEGTPGVYAPYPLTGGELSLAGMPGEPGTALGDVPVRPVEERGDAAYSTVVVDSAVVPDDLELSYRTVAVPSTAANSDVVRTALAAASHGAQIESREVRLASQEGELGDVRRVTVIGLTVAALLGGCSAAIATAGSVMDRRRTFGALIAAGTPVRVLARALRAEAGLPAFIATAGAGIAGTFVGVGLFSLLDDGDAVVTPWLAAPIVLGLVVALIASSVCTPALNRVRSEPLSDE